MKRCSVSPAVAPGSAAHREPLVIGCAWYEGMACRSPHRPALPWWAPARLRLSAQVRSASSYRGGTGRGGTLRRARAPRKASARAMWGAACWARRARTDLVDMVEHCAPRTAVRHRVNARRRPEVLHRGEVFLRIRSVAERVVPDDASADVDVRDALYWAIQRVCTRGLWCPDTKGLCEYGPREPRAGPQSVRGVTALRRQHAAERWRTRQMCR
jgi:hypothetical protein